MRRSIRSFAVAGIFVATVTGSAEVASATQDTGPAQVECTYATDRSTFSSVVCKTNSRYRIVVDYCRVSCVLEFGPWKKDPFRSEVTFPPGGTIVNPRAEIG